ncbi:MAG: hypothetical protein F6K10_01835 [Moorea sp. SIO2B7]|nr:hypothetical protein [Moorena sp. SIO2B7]
MLTLSAAISLFTVSCAETKFSQCQKIFGIANGVAKETKSLTNSGQEIENKTWLKAADTMEQAAQEMQALAITDDNLLEYQAGFVKMYRSYSEATREIIKAREDKDRPGAEAAQEKVKQAGKLEKEIGDGINSYCRK